MLEIFDFCDFFSKINYFPSFLMISMTSGDFNVISEISTIFTMIHVISSDFYDLFDFCDYCNFPWFVAFAARSRTIAWFLWCLLLSNYLNDFYEFSILILLNFFEFELLGFLLLQCPWLIIITAGHAVPHLDIYIFNWF